MMLMMRGRATASTRPSLQIVCNAARQRQCASVNAPALPLGVTVATFWDEVWLALVLGCIRLIHGTLAAAFVLRTAHFYVPSCWCTENLLADQRAW